MPLIQNPGPGRKLQRGLRLTELPDGVLAPEIVGVILVEDYSAPLTDIERGCQGSDTAPSVAAEFPHIALVRVGAPARYDLVVNGFHFSTGSDQQVELIVPTAGIGGLSVSANTSFTDLELPGRPSSQLGFDTQGAVVGGRVMWDMEVLAGVFYNIPMRVRVGTFGGASGNDLTSLVIVGTTANTFLRGGFTWTESPPQG